MTWGNADFEQFLGTGEQLESQDPDRKFVWRNFGIEERLTDSRLNAYSIVENASLTSFGEWKEAHTDYWNEEMAVARPSQGLPKTVDVSDPATGAPTFRCPDSLLDPNRLDSNLHLVRVERLDWVASSHDLTRARAAFHAVAGMPATKARTDAQQLATAILTLWNQNRDLRPVWAALRGDLDDLLVDKEDLATGWENTLRDRLGLAHLYGSAENPIDIVVFSYPIKILPTQGGSDRAITHPTVIDGPLNSYFCPSPSESSMGWAVNLDSRQSKSCRELLHPPAVLESSHVLAVGQIDSAAPNPLSESRREHLLFLQDKYDRKDFSALADKDILP